MTPQKPQPTSPDAGLTLTVRITEAEAQARAQLTGRTTGPLVRVEVAHGAAHVRRFLPKPLAKALAERLKRELRAHADAPWYVVAIQVASGQSLLVASGQGLQAGPYTQSKRRAARTHLLLPLPRQRSRPARAANPASETPETNCKPFAWLRHAATRPNDFQGPEQPRTPTNRPVWQNRQAD